MLAKLREHNDFLAYYRAEVFPFLEMGRQGTFVGTGNTRLRYFSLRPMGPMRGAVVVAPGRVESFAKYGELVFDLGRRGYAVHILDHRGQGESQRLTDVPELGHVDAFAQYVADFSRFVELVSREAQDGNLFVIAHSMGATIVTLYCSLHRHPFRGIIMSSPMFQIDFQGYPEPAVYALAQAQCHMGNARQFAMGQGRMDVATYGEDLTRCQYRLNWWRQILKNRPEIRLGGPSNGWLKTSIEASWKAALAAPRIQLPVLLLQAGSDLVVRPERQNLFAQLSSWCSTVTFPGAYHDLFIETEETRTKVLQIACDFMD